MADTNKLNVKMNSAIADAYKAAAKGSYTDLLEQLEIIGKTDAELKTKASGSILPTSISFSKKSSTRFSSFSKKTKSLYAAFRDKPNSLFERLKLSDSGDFEIQTLESKEPSQDPTPNKELLTPSQLAHAAISALKVAWGPQQMPIKEVKISGNGEESEKTTKAIIEYYDSLKANDPLKTERYYIKYFGRVYFHHTDGHFEYVYNENEFLPAVQNEDKETSEPVETESKEEKINSQIQVQIVDSKLTVSKQSDEYYFASKFNLSDETQRNISNGLRIIEEIQFGQQSIMDSERTHEKATAEFLVENAEKAIKEHETRARYWAEKIGISSAYLMAITFGFIEGGFGIFKLLEMLSTPSLIASCIVIPIALGLAYMQYQAYGKETPETMIQCHAKNRLFEHFIRWHDEDGWHELNDSQKKQLMGFAVLSAVTAIAIGALSFESIQSLPMMLSFGVIPLSVFPPALLTVIAITAFIGISINITYMLMEGYSGYLQADKSLLKYIWDMIQKPFLTTKELLEKNNYLKECDPWAITVAKGASYFIIAACYLLITAGLVFAGMAAQKNLAAFSSDIFGASAKLASIIGIAIGSCASVLGRVMFTFGRASTFTDTLSKIAFTNGSCGKELKWKETLGAIVGTVECGLFIGFSQSSNNTIVTSLAAASAGIREASGEIKAMVQNAETPEAQQKKAQLKSSQIHATVGLFRTPRTKAANQENMIPRQRSASSLLA